MNSFGEDSMVPLQALYIEFMLFGFIGNVDSSPYRNPESSLFSYVDILSRHTVFGKVS